MSEEQSGDEVREMTADETAELEKLDEAIAKFEQQKRWSDMIRSILKKAELVQEPAEKVELFRTAGTLYLERSSNQAEAIKCFEQLLEHDATDVGIRKALDPRVLLAEADAARQEHDRRRHRDAAEVRP